MPLVAVATFLLVLVPQYSFAQTASSTTGSSVEEKVRSYFADIPAMISIAQCESDFRQFDSDGSVLHGGTNDSMIGIFQINGPIHATYAKSIGMNINTVDGNLAYARLLYKQEKTQPWISSFPCWHLLMQDASSSTPDMSTDDPHTLTSDLTLGMVSPQVLSLQRLLNKTGFIVASSGDGSPRHEATKFGLLTRAAVRSFQCAKDIVCTGDEYTTGYGLVDVRTRVALAYAVQQSGTPSPTPASATSSIAVISATSSITQTDSDHVAQITQLQTQIVQLQKTLTDLLQNKNA